MAAFSQVGSAAAVLVCLALPACGGGKLESGRVMAGVPRWCPLGMAAPEVPSETVRTEPVLDPLLPREYFAEGAIRLPSSCARSRRGCSWFRRERAAAWLNLLEEPPLLHGAGDASSVRILYDFASVNRPRAVIRVSRGGGGDVRVVAKVTETLSVADQGRLMWLRTRNLTRHGWKRIEDRLGSDGLWDTTSISEREVSMRDSFGCADPLCYLVEIVRGGEQRVLYDCPCYGGTRTSALVQAVEGLARCE